MGWWAASAALLVVLAAARAGAAPPAASTVLDFAVQPRLLDTHLTRYGPNPTRTVTRDTGGARIRLPAKSEQTGLYSYFALAGDCEVSLGYELVAVSPAKTGYGASVGLAFDTDGPAGWVGIARGFHPTEGSAYWLTRATPSPGGETQYDTTFLKTTAKKGRLGLKREKDEVACQVADFPGEPLREVGRLPFTAGTVRPVRVYADTGGAPAAMDVRLLNLQVTAQELTGGIPEIGRDRRWAWQAVLAGVLAIGVAAGLWLRRRARRKQAARG